MTHNSNSNTGNSYSPAGAPNTSGSISGSSGGIGGIGGIGMGGGNSGGSLGGTSYPNRQYRTEQQRQPNRSLWLGNVLPDVTEQELRNEFEGFGTIETVKILPHKLCAFINYVELDSAIACYNSVSMGGRLIRGSEN